MKPLINESATRERAPSDEFAFTVSALADKWRCGKRSVYEMIGGGDLRAFRVGQGKRGLRVSAEEVRRWERTWNNGDGPSGIGPAIAPSSGEEARRLPASTIRALTSASE